MFCATCNKVPAACNCRKGSPWRNGLHPGSTGRGVRQVLVQQRADSIRQRREIIVGRAERDKATDSRESRLRLGHDL